MKYDWEAIKKEYITKNISIQKLAEKYNIPYRTISNKAFSQKWADAKRDFREKKETKTFEKTLEKVSEIDSDKLVKAIAIVDAFSDRVQTMMDDKDQFRRRIYQDEVTGKLKEIKTRKYDIKAMKEASEVIKDLVELTRNVYNLPVENDESDGNINITFNNGIEKYGN